MLTYFTVHNECIMICNHPGLFFFHFPALSQLLLLSTVKDVWEQCSLRVLKYILNIFYTLFTSVYLLFISLLCTVISADFLISGFTSSSLFLPHFVTKFFSDNIDFYQLAFINIASSVTLNILYMFIIIIYIFIFVKNCILT